MSESDQNDTANDAANSGGIVYKRSKSNRPGRVAETIVAGGYGQAPYWQASAPPPAASEEQSLVALYQEIGEVMDRVSARISAITADVRLMRHEIASTHLYE